VSDAANPADIQAPLMVAVLVPVPASPAVTRRPTRGTSLVLRLWRQHARQRFSRMASDAPCSSGSPARCAAFADASILMGAGGKAESANLFADPEAEVWGVLYRLTRRDLVRLDATEGIP
jgi:hypothetical protein